MLLLAVRRNQRPILLTFSVKDGIVKKFCYGHRGDFTLEVRFFGRTGGNLSDGLGGICRIQFNLWSNKLIKIGVCVNIESVSVAPIFKKAKRGGGAAWMQHVVIKSVSGFAQQFFKKAKEGVELGIGKN